MNQNYSITGIN